MSVHKRGDKWIMRGRYRDPDDGSMRQLAQQFDDERDARYFDAAWKDSTRGPDWVLRELDGDPRQSASAPTLSEVFEAFAAWKAKRVASPRTVGDYRAQFTQWILPYFNDIPVTELTPEQVQHWVDWMFERKGLSAKSVVDRHALLHGLVGYVTGRASDWDVTMPDPCHGTDLPKRKKQTPRGFLPEEWAVLRDSLAQVGDDDALDLVDFLIGTGWRWSEATALNGLNVVERQGGTWVTMERVMRRISPGRYLLVEGEGKSDSALRTVTVHASLADVLARRKAALANPTGLVFTTKTGAPWTYSNFYARIWRPALEIAGMLDLKPRPSLHWLRHSHIQWLIDDGVPMHKISKRVGHASITTTSRVYGSRIDDVTPDDLNRLNAKAHHAQADSKGA